AFVNNELIPRVRIARRDFECFVKVTKRIIVRAQVQVSVPDRAEITDLRSDITRHHCTHEGAGDFLASWRHVSFEKQRESKLAGGAVFQFLVAKFLREFKCRFPIAAHRCSVDLSVDVTKNHETKQSELFVRLEEGVFIQLSREFL